MTAETKSAPLLDHYLAALQAGVHMLGALQNAAAGMTRYQSDFLIPYLLSTIYFQRADHSRSIGDPAGLCQAGDGKSRSGATGGDRCH
jgi:hypothetical protein